MSSSSPPNTHFDAQPSVASQTPRFLSWRWRFIIPLFAAILVVTVIGTYLLVSALGQNLIVAEENVLLLKTERVTASMTNRFERLRSEARRTAFTVGVTEAINTNDVETLQSILRGIASASDLDSLIVTDAAGIEVAGVLRIATDDATDYSVSTGTSLADEALLSSFDTNAGVINTAILRTTQGLFVYLSLPILDEANVLGFVLVGQSLTMFLDDLSATTLADIVVYGADGLILGTTFDLNQIPAQSLSLNAGIQSQALTSRQQVLSAFAFNNLSYRMLTMPFDFGGQTLGVMSIAQPDDVPFATFSGRQASALFIALFAGVVVLFVLITITLLLARVRRVASTVDALTTGDRSSRTAMQPVDEVSQLGHAIDQYATQVQKTEDRLQTMLRRQRRERNYLMSVLESMPDGVVVQDEQANLVMMNDVARDLFHGDDTSKLPSFDQFDALIKSQLGHVITPGVYALGDPMMIENDGKMLNAQAAAILSPTGKRLGTVIIVRDMTASVRQSQAHDILLDQLNADIHEPLAKFSREHVTPKNDKLVNNFAREIARHAANLQKMIVDMRELTRYTRITARERQRVISIDTLVWAVANDWRQIAFAAGLSLDVDIAIANCLVLGDESRLRYALGNIVDNAIKYTPSGGRISVEVKDVINDTVHLRVRDNGVGISAEDYSYIFTPFYRGNPSTESNQVIHVPGMGLGLAEAQKIVEAHGGVIRVKTRHLIGTAVYLALPLTSGESYGLPLLSDVDLEGDTVLISDPTDTQAYKQDL